MVKYGLDHWTNGLLIGLFFFGPISIQGGVGGGGGCISKCY